MPIVGMLVSGRTVVVCHNIKACAVEEIKCILFDIGEPAGREASKLTAQLCVSLRISFAAVLYRRSYADEVQQETFFLKSAEDTFVCVDLLHYLEFSKLIDL